MSGSNTSNRPQPAGRMVVIGFRYDPKTRALWLEPQGNHSIRLDQRTGAICFEPEETGTQPGAGTGQQTTTTNATARPSRSRSRSRSHKATQKTMVAGSANAD